MSRILLAMLMLLALPLAGGASDLRREQEYAASLAQQPPEGKMVWLTAGDAKFIAIYNEAEHAADGNAVILLHDAGAFPDQKPLIGTLRTELPKHRWSALALQMPLREAGAAASDYYALFDEAKQRIDAAVDFLKQQSAQHIVVIGHGTGALMAAYTASSQPEPLAALVTLSLPLPVNDTPQAQTLEFLKKIELPLLDLYGENDLADTVGSATDRRMAAKSNAAYRQMQLAGEDHGYRHDPQQLVKRLYGWLNLTIKPQ